MRRREMGVWSGMGVLVAVMVGGLVVVMVVAALVGHNR